LIVDETVTEAAIELHTININLESRVDLDTIDKQHPFLAPAQPKIDVMKSTTPTPMNTKINLQKIQNKVLEKRCKR